MKVCHFLGGDTFGSRSRSQVDKVASPLGRDNPFSEIEMKENSKIPLDSRDRVTDVDQLGIFWDGLCHLRTWSRNWR